MTQAAPWSEDLLWQAQRGMELGRAFCTCEGRYHWSYGILRAAGVTSSLRIEEPMLASLMSPLIGHRARVMIGGSADPGLLCVVGRFSAAQQPRITIVDRCRAPLALIEEFAASRMLDSRTLQADLLGFEGRGQWDNILLHYTPDFVAAGSRPRFFDSLAASLAPGGTLVCVSMFGPKVPADRKCDLKSALRTYTLNALRQSPLATQEREPEFDRMLDDYTEACALRRLNYPASNELRDLLRQSAFRIVTEQLTPRKRRFFEIDPTAEPDTSSIIIATRD
jgi:SAM-dependent methyltransferase